MSGPDIITAAEVGRLAGLDVKSVYAGARAGEIPCRIVGRRFIFERGVIMRWLVTHPLADGPDVDAWWTKPLLVKGADGHGEIYHYGGAGQGAGTGS